jgi:hypothetical protein
MVAVQPEPRLWALITNNNNRPALRSPLQDGRSPVHLWHLSRNVLLCPSLVNKCVLRVCRWLFRKERPSCWTGSWQRFRRLWTTTKVVRTLHLTLRKTRYVVMLSRGTHYPHVTWAHVMLRVQLGYLTLNSGSQSHFCHSAYVTWSDVELWSAHVTARLLNFCCRTHFVRREVRELTWCYECSWDI